MFKNIKYYLQIVLLSKYWFRVGRFNKQWDDVVTTAIKSGNVKYIDKFKSEVGGVLIWTENFQFAYGSPYAPRTEPSEILPSRLTMLKLRDTISPYVPKKKTDDEIVAEYMRKK